MTLPERLYYPLGKAATELGCDVSDIIHFAANRNLRLCVKIFETPIGIEEVSEDWSADLLVNEKYLNSIVKEYYAPADDKFVKDENGNYFAEDEVNFDFVNSYVRLQGRIRFFIDKSTGDVCDYSTDLYGVYGLLQLGSRTIYMNEENIINGGNFKVSSFVLPIDDMHNLANGYFKRYVSEFANDDWVSDYIEKDSDYLRSQTIENAVSKMREPLVISADQLFVTKDEIERLKKGGVKEYENKDGDISESAKTIAKKGEIINCLLKMIPEISGLNVDIAPVSKIKEVVEALAAGKNIELPDTHPQTWARYLGRMRKVK